MILHVYMYGIVHSVCDLVSAITLLNFLVAKLPHSCGS